METEKLPSCLECKKGSASDTDTLMWTVVYNPEKQKRVRRGYLCKSHREMFSEDGFDVYECFPVAKG